LGTSVGLAELSDVFGEEKKLCRGGNENANYPIAGDWHPAEYRVGVIFQKSI
jgi:hypothetical protein